MKLDEIKGDQAALKMLHRVVMDLTKVLDVPLVRIGKQTFEARYRPEGEPVIILKTYIATDDNDMTKVFIRMSNVEKQLLKATAGGVRAILAGEAGALKNKISKLLWDGGYRGDDAGIWIKSGPDTLETSVEVHS